MSGRGTDAHGSHGATSTWRDPENGAIRTGRRRQEHATMPQCITFTRKGATEPSMLADVDRAICEHLRVPEHPTDWCCDWFSVIGLYLACGRTHGEIADLIDDRQLLRINRFLQKNYDHDSWYQVGR